MCLYVCYREICIELVCVRVRVVWKLFIDSCNVQSSEGLTHRRAARNGPEEEP